MDPELKKALDALNMTLDQAVAAQNKALTAFREESEANDKKRDSVNDEKLTKLQKDLDRFEPLSAAINDAKARADKADEEAKERGEQLDRIEAKMNRPGTGGENPEAKAYNDAFFAYARADMAAFNGDRKNVLQVSDDSKAGYLAPKELVMSILKEIEEFSPMRGLVTIRQTGSRAIQVPKRTALPTAVWTGETEARPDTEGLAFGMLDIPAHESTMAVPVTNAMLEDNEFNLEDEIREAVSIAYGKQEGAAIISGSGAGRPQGFLNATGTVSKVSGNATDITADSLIDLKYAVKTSYAQSGSYVLNRSTLGTVRKMKDGNGQYLWAAGLAAGRANTIDGAPYTEMMDMPNVGAGLKPVAFGDWKRGYMIVDRLDMSMLRDPYTRAGNGQVLFRWRRRLGGLTTIAEAIAILTVSV